MNYWRSLRARLSLLFMVLFATIVLLGLASAWSLSNANEVSNDVLDRWLPSTRLLGDLNNFTSDYRTAEADSLLAANSKELADSLHDIGLLEQAVLRAQRDYEQIRHNQQEAELYQQFSATWTIYKGLASRVTTLVSTGHAAEAAELYRTTSRTTYDAASDMLGRLTDYNVTRASLASERSVLAYQRARWLLGAALAVSAGMLTLVTLQIRRSVSRPLLDLGDVMRRLAANDTGVAIGHTSRQDEIGEMARAVVVFRSNAIDLMQSQRDLAQQAAMLEQKLAHEQQVMQLQRNFVSMISHEFRTPLAQIDAQAQRLVNLRDRLCPDDVANRARHIRASVERVIRLIDDLLNTSRLMDIDTAPFFRPETINLVAVLRDVCRSHRETSPGAQILEDYSAAPLVIRGDADLLFQAVSNLIANAIKYSPGGAKITVSASQQDGSAVIVVADQGIGIPAQDIEYIFTPYYRGSNALFLVGTGVGLFLVATVVRMHGGSIAVESQEGEGSRFTMTLPG